MTDTIKKVTEMQEMQDNSSYISKACEVAENRTKEAASPHMIPKTVIEMVDATKLSERCNYENFANESSVKELNERIRQDRIFLMHNRRKLKREGPKKPGML